MRKSGALLSLMIFLGSFCLSTAGHAQGFLEMLFGRDPPASASRGTPTYAPEFRARAGSMASHHSKYAHMRHKKSYRAAHLLRQQGGAPGAYLPAPKGVRGIEAAADSKACCSDAPAAIAKILHNDPTLRPGDAYMTSDGLRVFVGAGKSDPQFVTVDQAHRIGRALQARLAALDKLPYVEKAVFDAGPRRASGASARADGGQKLSNGWNERIIKTTNGKAIRLVGGYAS